MPGLSRSIVQLDNVHKVFPLGRTNAANVIKGITLHIHEGEFVTLYGPSGSGKSTLLNLMAGLETPSEGRVLVGGRDLAALDNAEMARYHRRKVGMVFQTFNLVKSLNVWENVALPQTAGGIPLNVRRDNAIHLLEMMHLGEKVNRHINELSGGEQQRVAIARTLVNRPYLILMDEPTGNLDTVSADEIMNIAHGLNEKARHTVVLVTHNPDYLHYSTRIMYIRDGRLDREEVNPRAYLDHILPDEHFDVLRNFRGECL